MRSGFFKFAASAAAGAVLALGLGSAIAAETPKRGGTLKFVIPAAAKL